MGVLVVLTSAICGFIVLRQQRRLLASTSWPTWAAERRRLPCATRRRVERAVVRGHEVPPEDAGTAVRHAEALMESLAAHRNYAARPSARRWFVAAAVLGVLAFAVNLAGAIDEPSVARVLSAGIFAVLVPLWVLMARGHDLTARRAANVRTARDLAARQLAEADPAPTPPAHRP